MTATEKALARIEGFRTDDASINAILNFLEAWVKADGDDAARRVMTKKNTPKGAYQALMEYAKNHQKGGRYGYETKEALVKIMGYYGVSEKAADSRLEDGLMYAYIKEELARWQPYGNAPEVKTDAKAKEKGGLHLSLEDLGI